MAILVTGAAGFIGSGVARALAERNESVLSIDNFSDYYSVNLKKARVKHFLQHPNIIFQEVDLADVHSTTELFSRHEISGVLHFAAQAGVRIPNNQLARYGRDNLLAFSNLLTEIVEKRIETFLYASSSSVYGNTLVASFIENSSVPMPHSLYGATKLSNELLARMASKTSGLKSRGLRLFTVYGPWGRPDMVYFRMLNSALSGRPFEFYGDGTFQRDFTNISDVVDISISLFFELIERKSGFADVVNVGGGNPKSINEILTSIEASVGSKVPFLRRETDTRDVVRTHANYEYLQSLIGKRPKEEIHRGIKEFVAWGQQDEIRTNLDQWVSSVK